MPKQATSLNRYHPAEIIECKSCGGLPHSTKHCPGKVKNETRPKRVGEGTVTEKVYECPEEVEGPHIHRVCDRCGRVTVRRGVYDD